MRYLKLRVWGRLLSGGRDCEAAVHELGASTTAFVKVCVGQPEESVYSVPADSPVVPSWL